MKYWKNIYAHCRYDFSDSNRHGTRCAGQVAATPNNTLCIVGIAFNAQIGGIRMLDGQVISIIISIVSISTERCSFYAVTLGQVSDAVEAKSLSFNPDHIHIYR